MCKKLLRSYRYYILRHCLIILVGGILVYIVNDSNFKAEEISIIHYGKNYTYNMEGILIGAVGVIGYNIIRMLIYGIDLYIGPVKKKLRYKAMKNV